MVVVALTGVGLLSAATGGVSQDTSQEQLPPGHWAYRDCYEFAKDGWIDNYPSFSFAGGRIFTRSEIPVGAKNAASSARQILPSRASQRIALLTSGCPRTARAAT